MPSELKHACENCNGHIAYDMEFAGQTVNCPHCGESTQIPKQGKTAGTNDSRKNVPRLVALVSAGVVLLAGIIVGVGFLMQPMSAREVFTKYAQCGNVNERLQYVFNVDEVESRMRLEYENETSETRTLWQELTVSGETEKLDEKLLHDGVTTCIRWGAYKTILGADIWKHYYYLRKQNDEWKIDWLMSMEWSSMSGKEFLLTKPRKLQEMRVHVELSSSLSRIADEDREKVWPLSLEFADGEWSYNGFVKRDSEIGRKLYEKLKDVDSSERWTLKLRYQIANKNELIEVTDGSYGWWTPKTTP